MVTWMRETPPAVKRIGEPVGSSTSVLRSRKTAPPMPGTVRPGDTSAAELQARIAHEELGHVRFAVHWFERWTQGLSFERWCAELPPPLSPRMMRGKRFNRDARARAGMREPFLSELELWREDAAPDASDPS